MPGHTLTDLSVDFVSLVDRAAVRDAESPDEPCRFLLWKSADFTPQSPDKEATVPEKTPQDGGQTVDDLTAKLEKAQADNAALTEKLDAAVSEIQSVKAKLAEHENSGDGEGDKPDPMNIDKAELPPAVRALVEKAEADQAAMTERLEKAETIAKEEREQRVTREFIVKADEFKALPIEAAKFGPVLKACAEKLTKDEADEIDRILKAADEQISSSDLFKSVGRSGDGRRSDDPVAEVQAKAAELKKAESSLSEGQALERALSSDSDLQARYLNAVR